MEKLYEKIKKNNEIKALLHKGNQNLDVLGFTDHSEAHTVMVAERAARILTKLGFDERTVDLAKVAGYMHDIGNSINRTNHAEYGGILAYSILKEMKELSLEEQISIASAIAHHDESTGGAVDVISAALIIADKSDVRRSRVRQKDIRKFDIHDRVNYAVLKNDLIVDKENGKIVLDLEIDEEMGDVLDYFDIFLERMIMCRKATYEFFGLDFDLVIQGKVY